MENVEIDEERSNSENSTSTEITKASDIREVSESEYDADDEKDLVTDFEGWTQDDLTSSTSSIYITADEYSDETELPVLDPKELKYLDEDLSDNETKILHSKKAIRIKRKHRVRAFPIPADDTSDSESMSSVTVAYILPVHVYRPAVQAIKHKSKIRRFVGRVVRVFRCCFGS